MKKTVDNYNAEQCCVALHSLREKKAYTRKKLDVLTDSQVMIRALQLQLARDVDDSVNLCSPSPDVDVVSDNSPLPARYQTTSECSPYDDSPYTSSNLRTDGQPNCSWSDCLQHSFPDGKPGRGLPSNDDRSMQNYDLTKNEEPAPRANRSFSDASVEHVSNRLKSDKQPNCSKSKSEHSLPFTAKYRQKISRFPDKEEREVLNFLLHSESDKDLVPQIRHKKVDDEEIKVICKRIENVIKDKNSSIDTQKAMYEAKYMIRTLWKRKEEGAEDIFADDAASLRSLAPDADGVSDSRVRVQLPSDRRANKFDHGFPSVDDIPFD